MHANSMLYSLQPSNKEQRGYATPGGTSTCDVKGMQAGMTGTQSTCVCVQHSTEPESLTVGAQLLRQPSVVHGRWHLQTACRPGELMGLAEPDVQPLPMRPPHC